MANPFRKFREEKGLSQQELADLLGYHRLTIVRYETGKRKVSPREIPHIVEKTGIPARRMRPDLFKILGAR